MSFKNFSTVNIGTRIASIISNCFKPGGMVMSEFSLLYRSLHRNQKITKPVEEKVSTSETESGSKPETPVNLFRALISKIF